ncbi:LiaG family protein [Bacillus massilinigeriensis]|uniref:LiaG family protein n=1 Tax=Bacillus massilionigeriensis TaxID=1805475 RepID=UPI00096B1C36|nr:DUF4097 domain-containing protein [Bacillus massilionigeriensis]
MKKILVIFFVLIGIYIIYHFVTEQSWLSFGKKGNQAHVSERIDSIELEAAGARTTIIPVNNDQLKAELDGKGKVHVDKDGDTIKVTYKRNWFEWTPFFSKTNLKVYIPEDYHKDLSIALGSGSIHMDGKSKSNPIKLDDLSIDLGSGNIQLKNLDVDNFEHNGASGNLTVNSIITKESSINLSSGNVDLNHFVGRLEGDLSSGKINVKMDKLIDDVDIHVSSGKINLDLPKDADFKLDGKTSSGNISFEDFPLTIEKQESRKIQGTHGAGTHNIDITVSSGKVEIY